VHLHLHVSDLAKSREFYRKFFGVAPIKERPGYVKFLPEFAPVNLAISEGRPAAGPSPIDHVGIQVDSSPTVVAHLARVKAAGLPVREEMNVNCCHANQDKFWVEDPDGVEWEVYHLNYDLEDESPAPTTRSGTLPITKSASCCSREPAAERAGATMQSEDEIRQAVKRRYGEIATSGSSCCGDQSLVNIGYRPEELERLPQEALMGLGCGSPVRLAGISKGETVVDLGSGGGIDVFLAAQQVGPSGHVIGVDMTPEMLARARANAERLGLANVEFRQGLIEALPVPEGSVDVVLSNCVINLAPDKAPVFREIFRVLKPGGRLVVSDMVAAGELPQELRDDPQTWASCIGGAIREDDYLETIREAGFGSVEVLTREGLQLAHVYSVTVRAEKPGRGEPGGRRDRPGTL
jgi:SAM-dependent methyltransferase/catechol 2,3-dioxygenase-like lactoylglutathione lyase family enzyme